MTVYDLDTRADGAVVERLTVMSVKFNSNSAEVPKITEPSLATSSINPSLEPVFNRPDEGKANVLKFCAQPHKAKHMSENMHLCRLGFHSPIVPLERYVPGRKASGA